MCHPERGVIDESKDPAFNNHTMDLEQFISNALGQIIRAVDDAADAANREIILYSRSDSRTIEFDIAVTAEDVVGSDGKVGIKVISMGELGGNISKQTKN